MFFSSTHFIRVPPYFINYYSGYSCLLHRLAGSITIPHRQHRVIILVVVDIAYIGNEPTWFRYVPLNTSTTHVLIFLLCVVCGIARYTHTCYFWIDCNRVTMYPHRKQKTCNCNANRDTLTHSPNPIKP